MKFVIACVFAVLALQATSQEPQKPAEEKAAAAEAKPAAAAKVVNPVSATPESLANGKKVYGTDCAMCHGKDGSGNGDLATDMKLKLRDYREATGLKGMTDGEIYEVILKGKGQMMGEEGRLKPEQIWNVVNYVRSLGRK